MSALTVHYRREDETARVMTGQPPHLSRQRIPKSTTCPNLCLTCSLLVLTAFVLNILVIVILLFLFLHHNFLLVFLHYLLLLLHRLLLLRHLLHHLLHIISIIFVINFLFMIVSIIIIIILFLIIFLIIVIIFFYFNRGYYKYNFKCSYFIVLPEEDKLQFSTAAAVVCSRIHHKSGELSFNSAFSTFSGHVEKDKWKGTWGSLHAFIESFSEDRRLSQKHDESMSTIILII